MSATDLILKSVAVQTCQWRSVELCLIIMLYLVVTGCATWQAPPAFDDSGLRARAETEELRGVKLSAAVLSSDESQRMFGAKINETGVQPVWIEVENNTDQALWLLRSGADPDLFSPLEVAWSFHKTFGGETNLRLDEHFHALSFENPISAGTTQTGIIFTNPHRNTRMLSIDILGQGELFPFTLFPHVPDDRADESSTIVNIERLIEQAEHNYQDADRFRARLEQLPCCATSVDGYEQGDPLNVILVGSLADIVTAVVRRGFRTDRQDYDMVQHLFGRPPDAVARKAGQGGVPANWLRIWVAPLRYQGKAVFVVQVGRPIGWRFNEDEEKPLVLNPNVDEVRNLLIQDMVYSSGLDKLAFVTGAGATAAGEQRRSLGGASYHTDGLRAVMFLSTRPLSLSDVELLDWHPALKLQEIEAVKKIENENN